MAVRDIGRSSGVGDVALSIRYATLTLHWPNRLCIREEAHRKTERPGPGPIILLARAHGGWRNSLGVKRITPHCEFRRVPPLKNGAIAQAVRAAAL